MGDLSALPVGTGSDPKPPNSYYLVHLWEDDLNSTICGLAKEVVVSPLQTHGSSVRQCEVCFHVAAGWVYQNPTPAEAALLEVLFPNA